MPVATIEWLGGIDGRARIVEQTLLPTRLEHVDLDTVAAMWDAIKRPAVRGAPAIGIAGAFGVVLGMKTSKARGPDEFDADVDRVCSYLAASRPTAVNLFWALDRMKRKAREIRALPLHDARAELLREAQA